VFTQSFRRPYAPPPDSLDASGNSSNQTFLGTGDPNLVRVGTDPSTPDDGAQVAQQRPNPPPVQRRPTAPPVAPPQPQPPATSLPGRGYGTVPQANIERGMTTEQKAINRGQALSEVAKLPAPPNTLLLPDDWQTTKAPDLVDDVQRAAQRHNVPVQLLARMLYQEGKFNEPDKLSKSLVMSSKDPTQPLGEAQMTQQTLDDLRQKALARGDTARARELAGYSLANRAQAYDAAAERLAYGYRLLGSWPAAVAAYNMSPDYFRFWLKGYDANPGLAAPENLPKGLPGGPSKWEEIMRHVRISVRGRPEDFQTSDMYEPGNAITGFRVARPIPPFTSRVTTGDTRRNP
jgi:hypothetical protein